MFIWPSEEKDEIQMRSAEASQCLTVKNCVNVKSFEMVWIFNCVEQYVHRFTSRMHTFFYFACLL